jgi:ABC-type antimicrobial peptide transport system permease subunit
VITNAARLVGIGALIGLAVAAMVSRLIGSMLFGVQPLDAATFLLVGVVLLVTALLAISGPAWRAARIDPAVVLK